MVELSQLPCAQQENELTHSFAAIIVGILGEYGYVMRLYKFICIILIYNLRLPSGDTFLANR